MKVDDFDLSRVFSAAVLESERLSGPVEDEVRHIVFGTNLSENGVQPGQLIGVLLNSDEDQSHFRLYSVAEISSVPAGINMGICVRRVLAAAPPGVRASGGKASGYLCDLQVGAELQLLGPFGHPFPIPRDRTAPLLMIGAGTGIAPFRAFVRRIYERDGGWLGPVRLFHGARTGLEWHYQNDYRNDFAQYYDEHTFRAIQVVRGYNYSRSIPPGLELAVHVEDARRLLQHKRAHIYVAGSERLAHELERLLRTEFGREEWNSLKATMVSEQRWFEILY